MSINSSSKPPVKPLIWVIHHIQQKIEPMKGNDPINLNELEEINKSPPKPEDSKLVQIDKILKEILILYIMAKMNPENSKTIMKEIQGLWKQIAKIMEKK